MSPAGAAREGSHAGVLTEIPMSAPWLGEREEELAVEALRSGRLSLGPMTDRFERSSPERVGANHVAAVSSGTAGLHLAVRLAGLGPGDEVITTPFSFVASANCDPLRGRDAGLRGHRPSHAEHGSRRGGGGGHRGHRRRSSPSTSSATRPSSIASPSSRTATGSRSSRMPVRPSAPDTAAGRSARSGIRPCSPFTRTSR